MYAVLVSGGAGQALIEQLDIPTRYVENLVLEGLARVAASEPPRLPAGDRAPGSTQAPASKS